MEILPSIICANYLNLRHEVDILIQNNIKVIHCDVMDGNFVKQITFGNNFIRHLSTLDIKLSIHFMVADPLNQIQSLLAMKLKNIESIIFHIENEADNEYLIELIKSNNIKAGIAISPNTSLQNLNHILQDYEIDEVLVMTVKPGEYGQKIIANAKERVLEVKNIINKLSSKSKIIMDGGINCNNVNLFYPNLAQHFVIGSGIFNEQDTIENNIKKFYSIDNNEIEK